MRYEDVKEFCERGQVSPQRMRVIDRNAAHFGVLPLQLMESAGKSLAEMAYAVHPGRVLVLCGKGNNGGDGLVAARYLQQCERVDVIVPAEGMATEDAQAQLRALAGSPARTHRIRCREDAERLADLFSSADVIIDALLGIGVSGEPREPIASCVRMANGSAAQIIAADIPTPGIRAHRIVAFHRPKVEGSEVVDIGIPLAAECTVGPGDLTLLAPKAGGVHKGAGGKVLVVGGGPYQGAPYLAGLAALRAGADLVRIASTAYLPYPDLIVDRLEGDRIGDAHLDHLTEAVKWADVVVFGPGLGKKSNEVVCRLAGRATRAVFDADALVHPLPRARDSIYTPHAGEFRRMFGAEVPADPAARGRVVQGHATAGTVLLKGAVDIISDGERVRFNTTGCAAMTTGGTGDVLTGVAAALFCRLPAFEAACIAAYVNGRAGMAAAQTRGDGLLASDLLDTIPAELYG
ncbi:MAG: NAD(P)H-hydrate dehydratase [Methanomicrobiaceae archaeon]|nr:NAD(P)H-hydrate dehydratase [Methanomicrobiaceae archaeon]